jgi:hypothetical protein
MLWERVAEPRPWLPQGATMQRYAFEEGPANLDAGDTITPRSRTRRTADSVVLEWATSSTPIQSHAEAAASRPVLTTTNRLCSALRQVRRMT